MVRTVSIVGAGRVGRTLGKRLRQLGWRIGAVVTRSARHLARRCARHRRRRREASRLHPSTSLAADVIFLTTPDDMRSPASPARLPKSAGAKCRGKIVLHTSATLDRTVLAPLARRGAATGSLHPMQAFSGTVIPKLSGVIFAVEGDPGSAAYGAVDRKIAGRNSRAQSAPRDKPTYHAAAVLAAGSAYPADRSGCAAAHAHRLHAQPRHANAVTFDRGKSSII